MKSSSFFDFGFGLGPRVNTLGLLALILVGLLNGCGSENHVNAPNTDSDCMSGGDRKITVAWDAVTTDVSGSPASVTGYKIYYGVQSRNYTRSIDVGNVTEAPVNGLKSGCTYYVAVTAYNERESAYSEEASGTPAGLASATEFKIVIE